MDKLLRYAKFVVALATALLLTLNEVLPEAGGIIGEDWMTVLIALAGALGVRQVPNKQA